MKVVKLAMFAVILMAAGCKSSDKALLSAHEWQLKEMTGSAVASVSMPQEAPVIQFTDSTAVYGSAGCNRFFGTYTADDKGAITVQPGGSTMMFCPDLQFEDQYLKALGTIASYKVMAKKLELLNADGTLTLVYVPKDTMKLIGGNKDEHGCNAAAGFTWSEVQQDCIRLFESGIRMNSAVDTAATLSAFIVFASDSAKIEVFLPEQEIHPILDRRNLPDGGSAWNVEDDGTLNVRMVDGNWVIEQRGTLLYKEDKN